MLTCIKQYKSNIYDNLLEKTVNLAALSPVSSWCPPSPTSQWSVRLCLNLS